jgi:zona occludens toxin (predicted ATPase)
LYFSAISAIDSTSQYVIIRSTVDITTTSTVKIYSRPASNDVAPSRHQLVKIDMNLTTPNISATADAFAQSGVAGSYGYTTFSRDPQS